MAGPQGSSSPALAPPPEQATSPESGLPAQARSGPPVPQPPQAALVTTRDKSEFSCRNPVLGWRFLRSDGTLIPIPCGRNSCPACARRSAMVTAAMVGLDAQVDQPRVVSTFTTRDRVSPQEFNEAMEYLRRLIRVELGPVRSCSFLEFTTGEGRRSGGRRRPHLHTLWKDVGPEAAPVIAGVAVHVLERAAGAYRHDVEEIRSPAGATMYVARHHLKESQAPPVSWGPTRRVRPSRGYWSRPSKELRQEAKGIVQEKRVRRRIEGLIEALEREEPGFILDGQEIEENVERNLEAAKVTVVRICRPWEDDLLAAYTTATARLQP